MLSGIGLIIVFLITTALLTLHPDTRKEHIRFMMDHSKRVLAYKITNSREALFRTGPHDKRIEILSNLDLPPVASTETPDISDREQIDYSLEIRILDANLNLIRREVFRERTRASNWIDPGSGNPMLSACYLYEDCRACDSRITSLLLPYENDEECFIAIRILSPTNSSASVRAYRHLDLTAERDIKGIRLMPRRFRTKLARHNLYENDLTPDELAHSMTDVLSQIPAETRQGFEYCTRQLFLYEDVAPIAGVAPPASTSGMSLEKPVFFAVTGPAVLTLTLTGSDPIDTDIRRDDIPLSTVTRKPDSNRHIAYDIGPGEYVIKIKDPSASQRIEWVELDPPTAWSSSGDDPSALYPVSRTAYYRALPRESGSPITIALPQRPGNDPGLIKMICRIPLDMELQSRNPDDLIVKYVLTCRYLDAGGNPMNETTVSGRTSLSPVARYELRPTADDSPSLPERWFLTPPAGAERMEITANRSVDIAFFTRLENPSDSTEQRGPAGNSQTNGIIRLPDDSADYYFRPFNADDLAANVRKFWVNVPAGLFETPESIPNDDRVLTASSCYPVSQTPPEFVFEPMPAGESNDQSYIRFMSGESVAVDVQGNAAYARPGFYFRLKPVEDPWIAIVMNGRIITRFRPVACEGFFETPAIGSGMIQVLTSSESDQVFMKRPAGVTCDAVQYAARKAYRLDPGQSMTIPLTKYSWHPTGLNILAYRLPDQADPVLMEISSTLGKTPEGRPVSSLTCSRISVSGIPVARPSSVVTESGQMLTTPERFFYRINDDQAPDTYSITIESRSTEPVYLRFFTLSPENRQMS